MIEGLRRRLGVRRAHAAGGDPATGPESLEALRDEVRRLEQQNERLRTAMRQCIDCEYRIESIARRDAEGVNADGSEADAARG